MVLLGVLAAATAVLELTRSPLAPALVPACLGLGSGAAAVVAARGASRLPGRSARPWRALAVALGLLAVGQVLATVRAGADLQFGGAEDVPMLLAVPVAVLAALRLLPPRSRRWPGSRTVLDGLIATLAVAVLGHVLLAALLSGVEGAADGLIAVGYPAVGAVLVGVGLVTVTGVRGARRGAAVWLLTASVAMAVVAVGGALGRTAGSTAATVVTEQAWMAMLAAGVLAVRSDPGEPATPDHDRPIVPLRGLVLASGVASSVLLLLLAGVLAGRSIDPVEAGGGAALVVLTSLRTGLWAADGYRLTQRLVRTEGYFRALVHSGDAVTVVLDGTGRIGWASGAVEAQLGWTDDDLAGRLLADLLDDEDRDLVARVARAVHGGTTVGLLPATVRLRARDDACRDVEVTGAAPSGTAPAGMSGLAGRGGLVLHLRDVTDRSSRRRELERMAYTDFLTGLPNRARLMAALGEVSEGTAPGCLLLVDLDGFKAVNDVAGHDAGDRLLCEVAETLSAAAREDDVVARLGGDEFAVLVRAGREEATVLAERLVVLLDRDHRPRPPTAVAAAGWSCRSPAASAWPSCVPAGTPPRRCAGPTWRCGRPRPPARTASGPPARPWTGSSTGVPGWRGTCPTRSPTAVCRWCSSRWWARRRAACWGWRPWCAGGTGTWATSRRRSSSGSPRTRVSSCRCSAGCSARRPRPWRRCWRRGTT